MSNSTSYMAIAGAPGRESAARRRAIRSFVAMRRSRRTFLSGSALVSRGQRLCAEIGCSDLKRTALAVHRRSSHRVQRLFVVGTSPDLRRHSCILDRLQYASPCKDSAEARVQRASPRARTRMGTDPKLAAADVSVLQQGDYGVARGVSWPRL